MATELTRRELYDLVWAKPMTKVAADFGISDVGLHKICLRHRIPVPGRGYWAKASAGHPLKRALFRDVPDHSLNRVVITGGPLRSLPAPVAEARIKAIAAIKATPAPAPSEPTSPQPPLSPLLEPTRATAKKAKPGADGLIHLGGRKVISAVIAPGTVDRMLAILDQLMTAVEARGWKLEQSQSGAPHLLIDGEVITLELSEKTDRIRHEPTDRELAALNRWETKRERDRQLGHWLSDWDKPAVPEFDLVPNGLLVIEFDKGFHWNGLRRKFSDGKRQRLESLIDSMVVAAATCAAAIKAHRQQQEERRRQQEEDAKRRAEIDRLNRLHEKRCEFLNHQMKVLTEARQVETFVTDFTQQHPIESLPPSCQDFIDWAQAYAHWLRDKIAPSKLADVIDRHKLMDDSTNIYAWQTLD